MLLSIKTGGCPEDCAYCPQSAHYETDVARDGSRLPRRDDATRATRAREQGATRFCMGAAWRDVAGRRRRSIAVLEMVRVVRGLGMEACCTLGMLTRRRPTRSRDAGLTAYNHNLDTSPEFYGKIITTRTYDERLRDARARAAGRASRSAAAASSAWARGASVRSAAAAAALDPHPESVPVNLLVRVDGTPLADVPPEDPYAVLAVQRLDAVDEGAHRLAAGRQHLRSCGSRRWR